MWAELFHIPKFPTFNCCVAFKLYILWQNANKVQMRPHKSKTRLRRCDVKHPTHKVAVKRPEYRRQALILRFTNNFIGFT